MLNISLSGEKLGYFLNLPITNTLLTTWIVMFFITVLAIYVKLQNKIIPSNIQNAVEIFIEGLYSLFKSVLGKKTKKFFPLLATLFIFIIFNNWVELLPGIGSLGLIRIENGKNIFLPLFRTPTSDLNVTLSLAFIAVFAFQYYGLKSLGLSKYLKRFINFKSPVDFFVGILEIISEVAKIISFAFRLFGNLFAGEVLLAVVAFLIPLLAPLPFLGLELFVGFIQALVFSMLTAVFLSLSITEIEYEVED